jgi:hypothetical protein
MARLSEYDFELCKKICEQVAEGKNIKAVLRSDESIYPTFQTWCNWKREHQELFDLYVRSIQDKAESVDDQIDEILADVKTGKIDAAAARVIIYTLQWKASKYYPRMFGDKVDITTGNKPLPSVTQLVLQDGRTYEDLMNDLKPE